MAKCLASLRLPLLRQLVTTPKKLVEKLLKPKGSSWAVEAMTSQEILARKDATHTAQASTRIAHITDRSMVAMLRKISSVRLKQMITRFV
jgi:hypothetical protein